MRKIGNFFNYIRIIEITKREIFVSKFNDVESQSLQSQS